MITWVHHVLIIFIKPERALMIEHCAQRLRRKLGAIIKTAEDFPVLYCLPVAQLLECTGAQGFLLRDRLDIEIAEPWE